jgi:hypothetical protein
MLTSELWYVSTSYRVALLTSDRARRRLPNGMRKGASALLLSMGGGPSSFFRGSDLAMPYIGDTLRSLPHPPA